MRVWGCLAIVLWTFVQCSAQQWELLWSDEFSGSGVNTSDWTFDIGGSGWGNNELEYYTNRTENAQVLDGNLLIIARKESYGGNSYTSARVKSQGLQSFLYGKIEARIKLPVGQGIWPAFWMLGTSISQVGWPGCGEIDVMEHINSDAYIYGTAHWDNGGHVSSGGKIPAGDVRQYHLYSIEWNADSITWYYDGIHYWSTGISDPASSTDEFHSPFFLLLNMAVGGGWPGNPSASTSFPDTMFVDYVRIYREVPTGVNQLSVPLPDRDALLQIYPNPISVGGGSGSPHNSSSVISYQVSQPEFVSLKVYDILGREVRMLVSEWRGRGSYTVEFEASGLATGIYLCRLSSGSFAAQRKVLLVR